MNKYKVGDIIRDNTGDDFEITGLDPIGNNYSYRHVLTGATGIYNCMNLEAMTALVKSVSPFKIGDTIKHGNVEAIVTDIVGLIVSFQITVWPYADEMIGVRRNMLAADMYEENWVLKTSAPQVKQSSGACGCDSFTLFNRGCQCGAFKSELSKKGA